MCSRFALKLEVFVTMTRLSAVRLSVRIADGGKFERIRSSSSSLKIFQHASTNVIAASTAVEKIYRICIGPRSLFILLFGVPYS